MPTLLKEVMRSDFDNGSEGAAEAALLFFKHWLSNHIMKTDQQYAPLLQQNG
jgi:hemerythrin